MLIFNSVLLQNTWDLKECLTSVDEFILESPEELPTTHPSLKTPTPPAPPPRRRTSTQSRTQGQAQTKEPGTPYRSWASRRDFAKVFAIPVWPVRFRHTENCSTTSPTAGNDGPPATPNSPASGYFSPPGLLSDSTPRRVATTPAEKQANPSVQFYSHISLLVFITSCHECKVRHRPDQGPWNHLLHPDMAAVFTLCRCLTCSELLNNIITKLSNIKS